MRFAIVIPTFEPNFADSVELRSFYEGCFDSYYAAVGRGDVTLLLTDYMSNDVYKGFLRDYVARHPGARLLDGDRRLSSYDAVSLGFQALSDHDVFIWAAADTMLRDPAALDVVASHFADPDVGVVFPTVTLDGMPGTTQTQKAPLDRDPRVVQPPEFYNLVVAMFSRTFLQPFEFRLANRFPDGGAEIAIPYQAMACGLKVLLDYRCNMIHHRGLEMSRYDRTATAHWSRPTLPRQSAMKRVIAGILPGPDKLPLTDFSQLMPVLDAFRRGAFRRGAGLLYGFFLRSRPIAFVRHLKAEGMGFMLRFAWARHRVDLFREIPQQEQIALIRSLMYVPIPGNEGN